MRVNLNDRRVQVVGAFDDLGANFVGQLEVKFVAHRITIRGYRIPFEVHEDMLSGLGLVPDKQESGASVHDRRQTDAAKSGGNRRSQGAGRRSWCHCPSLNLSANPAIQLSRLDP